MRTIMVFATAFLLSGLSFAQVNVVRGYASNQPILPGYPAGFVPLINTPTASFDNNVPGTVGASNATAGNVAGASNATTPPASTNGIGAWYGSPRIASAMRHGGPPEQTSSGEAFGAGDAGISEEVGLAEVIGKSHAGGKASRTYTNQDIPGPDPNVGTVKIHGKTERLP